jgi:hypothetical protein
MRLDRQSLKLCHSWLAEQDPGSQYERDALLTLVQDLLDLRPGEDVEVGVFDDEAERTERLFELLDRGELPTRPEDAAPAILEAERWAAEHEKHHEPLGVEIARYGRELVDRDFDPAA